MSPQLEEIEDKIHRLFSNLEEQILQLFDIKIVEDNNTKSMDMLQEVLYRCMFQSQYIANFGTVKSEMPCRMRDFITGLLDNPLSVLNVLSLGLHRSSMRWIDTASDCVERVVKLSILVHSKDEAL